MILNYIVISSSRVEVSYNLSIKYENIAIVTVPLISILLIISLSYFATS